MVSWVLYGFALGWVVVVVYFVVQDFCSRSHRIFIFAQLLFLSGALVFFTLWLTVDWLPLPGFAVAIIAVAAATMSIHGEMGGYHKAIWMLIIGAFVVL